MGREQITDEGMFIATGAGTTHQQQYEISLNYFFSFVKGRREFLFEMQLHFGIPSREYMVHPRAVPAGVSMQSGTLDILFLDKHPMLE